MRIAFFILICLLSANCLSAQCFKGEKELSFGYGLATENDLDLNFFSSSEYDLSIPTGSFSVSGKYFISKGCSIGFTAGYENEHGKLTYYYDNGLFGSYTPPVNGGAYCRNYFVLVPEITGLYLNRRYVQ